MERAERYFLRFFVGYASLYQLLLLLECASQYVSGRARSFATHNVILNGLMLVMSLAVIVRTGQRQGKVSLSVKLILVALLCVLGKELMLVGTAFPYAYAELLNGECFFMVVLLYNALICHGTEYF